MKYPTIKIVRQELRYDPETGYTWWQRYRHGRFLDRPAGCTDRLGYRNVIIDGVKIGVHRIAFVFMKARWPKKFVDHIDGDSRNNKWNNLREATVAENYHNSRRARHNTSGLKGVSWAAPNKKWKATINVNKRALYLGYFDSKEAAHAAYMKAAIEHFGEFARAE